MENLQDVVHGFSFIGSLGPYSCPCTDLSELEDAISCDRKVQVKFETDSFLPPYVIHAAQVYKCARV